jgi:hypothetical protein
MRVSRGLLSAVLAGVLVVGTAAAASAEPVPDGAVRWNPALAGEATGVELTDGALRLAAPPADGTTAENGPRGDVDEDEPLGVLIVLARRLDVPVNRVDVALDATDGSGVTVDVRGKRANGKWMEWLEAEPPADAGGPHTAALHTPAVQVQVRVVFTPEVGRGAEVRGLTLTAYPARDPRPDAGASPAVSYRVFATHEGLVGKTTANGHVIGEEDMFVALPSRQALSPRDGSDYSVRVCAPNGRCAYAPVWDVGPSNTRDDNWSAPGERQDWRTCRGASRRRRPPSRTATTTGRTSSDARSSTPPGSTSPVGCSSMRSS